MQYVNMFTDRLVTSLLVKTTVQAPHIPKDWSEEIGPLKYSIFKHKSIKTNELQENTATNIRHQSI